MKALQTIGCCTVAISFAAMVAPQALAQESDQKVKARQVQAVTNARQIGLALFEFESQYGAFPNEKTAVEVKKATGTTAEVKAATANDCFFQMIAAKIVETDSIFSIGDAAAPEKQANPKPLEKVDKCFFAYLSGMIAAGNPSRPVLVAPLVKGKTIFDPQVLGGKAVILRVDNSVTSLPIQPDGRVLIDGKDIFDPEQPFWGGKVPPIKWPEK
jgi:hypothetical protein